MTVSHQLRRLEKFLVYILGHHPDEFGLIPDRDGFVKTKEVLKVLTEEKGWRHVRRSDLNELQLSLPTCRIEMFGNQIRCRQREHLPQPGPALAPPKLVYTCVRRRAYATVAQHGIRPGAQPFIILCAEEQLALRLGRRLDPQPILLTVNVGTSNPKGVQLRQYGRRIFLTDFIPADAFSGPPLPKERIEKPRTSPPEIARPRTPGSYVVDVQKITTPHKRGEHPHRKKEIQWKKERKQQNRRKKDAWP